MHEYRRFIQQELDAHGWKPSELARRAGLRRQLVHNILHDDRPRLGQMPDESTMEGIASAFGIPVERVRTAASRALRGYADDGAPLSNDLTKVSDDVLLTEIKRRFEEATSGAGRHVTATADKPKKLRVHRKGARDPSADEPPIEDRHQHGQ